MGLVGRNIWNCIESSADVIDPSFYSKQSNLVMLEIRLYHVLDKTLNLIATGHGPAAQLVIILMVNVSALLLMNVFVVFVGNLKLRRL